MYYTLRRWWNRYALQAGLIALAVGGAWAVKQSQGVIVYEIYQWLSRPFQPGLTQVEQIENAYVLELQQRIVELENQNQVLRRQIDYKAANPQSETIAAVIGRSADHWWRQVTLGKGSRDGIEVGYVVTGPGGLVGRVVYVTPHTSRVLLISDPTSRAGVKISRSRAMGYMRGQSANRVVMEFFDKSPDVKHGDVVMTSSYSRLFPKNIPIGRIESLDLTKSPAPEAVIQLSSPISVLEWVAVHPFNPLEDVDAPPAHLLDQEDSLNP
ncbi:MAG: rod shape-determining protein MreC [Pseudanabaenales cyanobacterium]|nr:rod shape-determining protein MreC [Pseudanabaenales cyanobacterium]